MTGCSQPMTATILCFDCESGQGGDTRIQRGQGCCVSWNAHGQLRLDPSPAGVGSTRDSSSSFLGDRCQSCFGNADPSDVQVKEGLGLVTSTVFACPVAGVPYAEVPAEYNDEAVPDDVGPAATPAAAAFVAVGKVAVVDVRSLPDTAASAHLLPEALVPLEPSWSSWRMVLAPLAREAAHAPDHVLDNTATVIADADAAYGTTAGEDRLTSSGLDGHD